MTDKEKAMLILEELLGMYDLKTLCSLLMGLFLGYARHQDESAEVGKYANLMDILHCIIIDVESREEQ